MYRKIVIPSHLQVERETPFLFHKHATIGCGGQAIEGFYPKTEEELAFLVSSCARSGIPYVVVGNLSNVLPSDGKIEKTVICTKKMQEMFFDESGVYVSAGLNAGTLLRACEKETRTGAEFLEGIPCTLGGALYMNAGVAGAYIDSLVQYVKVWYRGKTFSLNANDCEYTYKNSVFMREGLLILGAKLLLSKTSLDNIRKKKAVYRERRKHLPKGKSMGCVFKNPPGHVAGKLIEGAGLKGLRIGGARIANEHANFIINDGYATSTQVRELIGLMKGAVATQYGIQLQEEIRYLY